MYEDDDLQRALAESMRTFEAEQQGGPAASRKRSSSDDGTEGQQQQQDHTSVAQQPAEVQQQPAAGGALKRQRSISTPGSGTAGLEDLAGQHPQHTVSVQAHGGRLTRLGHGAVLITTSLQHPQQHHPLGIIQAIGLQRSASITNAQRLQPWPCSGVMQPQQWGLGRSASAQDLQAAAAQAEPAVSGDLAGSRPSSPAHAGQQRRQYDRVPGSSMLDMPDFDADDEDDAFMDVANSDDSMSSGRANTISSWGPALLQAAPPAAAQQRLIGAWPVPDDESEWRIHDRLFYEGQAIYWQQFKNGASYAGRVMTVEGGGSSEAQYMAEIHQHPQGLRYVEAVAAQLHPQLRIGDMVWCKPAAVKKACWSGYGPLYRQLHPSNQLWANPQPCQDAPWRMGVVKQAQLFDYRNPIAELRIVGTGGMDTCWFRTAQLELIREIGESSAAAERRATGGTVAAAGAGAAEGGAAGQAQGVAFEEVDLLADEQHSPQQQGQAAAAAAAADDDDALLQLAAASDQQDLEDLHLSGGAPSRMAAAGEQQQQSGQQQEAAEDQPGAGVGVSPGPDAAAAPSLLSHPAAALTGESELDAAAPAVTVEQAAGAVQPVQQQQHRPHAAAAAHPDSVATAGKAADQQQQLPAVLEGTGESAEALMAEEVVGDSFAGVVAEGEAAAEEPESSAPSPKEPLSNQHSGVEDSSTRVGQEGCGET